MCGSVPDLNTSTNSCWDRYSKLAVAGSETFLGRNVAAYNSDGNGEHDAVAVRVADNVSQFMTGAGEDAAADIYSIVQAHVVDLMAGAAGEMVFLGHTPPKFMTNDVINANTLAGIICRSSASRACFLEFCYQEALAIIEANKPVVLALANALIDHPARTLNSVEIDQCIADTLDREARKVEGKRRVD
jgi:hypothetical protein